MASDDDSFMTGVYMGVGLLVAVGAGYLVWRYAIDEGTKNKVHDVVQDAATSTKRLVRDTRNRLTP